MIRNKKVYFAVAALCIISMIFLAGCTGRSGQTINEPEITPDYLIEDYSQQLITDGGEYMTGTVDMQKADNTYTVNFSETDVIPNSDYDEGYYLANTNIYKEATLGSDARIVLIVDGETVVANADEFIKHNSEDKIYTVYFLGSSAELIIEVNPEDIIVEE